MAYCRKICCVLSFEAVAMLRRRGFLVRRLEEGFPEWKAADLATEASGADWPRLRVTRARLDVSASIPRVAQTPQLRKPARTSFRSGVKKLR